MKKRFLSFLIGLALLVTLAVPALAVGMDSIAKTRTYNGQFSDIRGHWCESYVADLYEYGMVEGRSAERLSPGENVTIAEVITLASRIHAAYYGETIAPSEGKWYDSYVSYARSNGIVGEALSANVLREANRGETATILAQALPKEQFEAVNQEITFFDVLQLDKYYSAVSLLSRAGVVNGYVDMSFMPEAAVTRAETMTMADRVVNKEMRLGYRTDNGTSSFKRDEEVGDYVSFACAGAGIFTMNRRDEGFTLSVLTDGGVATFAGLCELREGVGLICPLGDRIIGGEITGMANLSALVFEYDYGVQMKLIGAMDSKGRLVTEPGAIVLGALRIGSVFTATN